MQRQDFLKKNDDAKEAEEKLMSGMDKQNREEFKKKLDDFNKQIIEKDAKNPPVRKFA